MSKKILNAGCGEETYGTSFIDLYPSRKGVKRCDIDRDRFPYADNIFDEVYSNNNFEHLRNPNHFLSEAYRVLKRGGIVRIITDNAGFFGFFTPAHYGGHEVWHKNHPRDRHYMLFTPTHLKNWLEITGFRNIHITYSNLKSADWKIKLLANINKKFNQQITATGIK